MVTTTTTTMMVVTMGMTTTVMMVTMVMIMVTMVVRRYVAAIDSFGNLRVPSEFGALAYLAGPTLILALLIHPNLNNFFICDVSWTFALYV